MPKKPPRHVVQGYCSREEQRLIQAAADKPPRDSISAFVRTAAVNAAIRKLGAEEADRILGKT